MPWILFRVPTPTPDGRTAQDLYEKRVVWISEEMRESAREHGCRFHRAWYVRDGSAFYALAYWESRDGASAFFEEWEINDEPGEEAFVLEGDVGLVPLPDLAAAS
jgi:hypothetical protein